MMRQKCNASTAAVEEAERWSHGLEAVAERIRETLEDVIQAITTVRESDARAWFKHCGYVLP